MRNSAIWGRLGILGTIEVIVSRPGDGPQCWTAIRLWAIRVPLFSKVSKYIPFANSSRLNSAFASWPVISCLLSSLPSMLQRLRWVTFPRNSGEKCTVMRSRAGFGKMLKVPSKGDLTESKVPKSRKLPQVSVPFS